MKLEIEINGTKTEIESPFTLGGYYKDLQRLSDLLIHGIEQGGGDLFAYAWMPVTDAPKPMIFDGSLDSVMARCHVRYRAEGEAGITLLEKHIGFQEFTGQIIP